MMTDRLSKIYNDYVKVVATYESGQFPPWSEFFSVLVWAHFHQ